MNKKRKILTRRPAHYQADTNLKERNLVFVDLEFTGLELNHEILQIGCVVVSQPGFKVIREWERKVAPRNIAAADRNALKIVGYSAKKWKDAVPAKQALREFNAVAANGALVGYNVAWDFLFLKKAYYENRLNPSFHWQVLDVFSMGFSKLYRTRIKGYRMKEMVDYLKLASGKWHDALVDARATYWIFLELMKKRRT